MRNFSLSPIFIVAIIFSLPAIFIFLSLAQDFSSNWIHLVNTVLPEYLLNSLKLLFIGVSVGVFILGVSTGLIISTCEFRGKNFFMGPYSSFCNTTIYYVICIYWFI